CRLLGVAYPAGQREALLERPERTSLRVDVVARDVVLDAAEDAQRHRQLGQILGLLEQQARPLRVRERLVAAIEDRQRAPQLDAKLALELLVAPDDSLEAGREHV